MRAWLLVLAGCGRIGFGGGDAGADDPDAPGDLAPVPSMLRFGNRSDVDVVGSIADTFLDEGEPGNNVGNHLDLHLNTGVQPILMRFDLTTIPAHATVISARLSLSVSVFPIPLSARLTVQRLREYWMEGTGDHSAGSCNRDERQPGIPWATVGADAPGSRDAAILASANGPVAEGDTVVVALPVDLVQPWIADPSSNHGIAIVGDDPGGIYTEIASSEFSEELLRPVLELELR